MSAVIERRSAARVRWWSHADNRTASEALAAEVAIRLRSAIALRGLASLAVPGGSTPARFLEALSCYAVDWTRVVVTLTDERWVPERHPESNAGLVARTLLRYGAAQCTFRPLYVPGLLPQDALRVLDERLKPLPWPLDVVVVGMGLDGHVASLFPASADSRRVERGGRVRTTAAGEPARVIAAAAPDGTPRISLTLDALASARNLYVLIHGRRKQHALQAALAADDAESLPVRAVLESHAGRTVVHCSELRDA